MSNKYRILRSDGVVEINLKTRRGLVAYVRNALPSLRGAGVSYMAEYALDGEWRALMAV